MCHGLQEKSQEYEELKGRMQEQIVQSRANSSKESSELRVQLQNVTEQLATVQGNANKKEELNLQLRYNSIVLFSTHNSSKRFLEVPQFSPPVHKSKKHFGHSFAFDAATVWNDLPDDICCAPTFACFRKRLKSYPFKKAFQT